MDHHFIFLYERATVIWGWNILNNASMLERDVIVDLKATHVCMIYCLICSTVQLCYLELSLIHVFDVIVVLLSLS